MSATERLVERLETGLELERDERRELQREVDWMMCELHGSMAKNTGGGAMTEREIETWRRLAAAWERRGCTEAAKDALRRAEKLAKALEAAA